MFFARALPTRRIVAGQYLGFAAIIALSLIGVWLALAIPHRWIRALGLLPLVMGIKELLRTHRTEPGDRRPTNDSLGSVAVITLSNGADNIGVYVPFFLVSRSHLWLILIVYAALIAIWCVVSRWLGNHSVILRAVDQWGHWIVPLVLMGVGVSIFVS